MTHILGLFGIDGAGVSLRAAPTPSFEILGGRSENRGRGFNVASPRESVPSRLSRVVLCAGGGRTSGAEFDDSEPSDDWGGACEVLCAILLISTLFAMTECWLCLRREMGTEFSRSWIVSKTL